MTAAIVLALGVAFAGSGLVAWRQALRHRRFIAGQTELSLVRQALERRRRPDPFRPWEGRS